MRRLISATFLFLSLFVFADAQDIIITKDRLKIEAKVVHVNRSTIDYKEFDKPDGELKTMLKSNIASIAYENGIVEVYDNTNSEGQTSSVRPQARQALTCADMDNVTYKGGELFYNNRALSNKEIKYAIRNCKPELYKQYQSGHHRMVAGIVTTCVGLDFLASGCVFIAFSSVFDNDNDDDDYFEEEEDEIHDIWFGLGVGFAAVGATATAIGVPLWVSGVNKRNRTIQQFKDGFSDCTSGYSEPVHIDLVSHKNNIGLALKF